jgi:hypothetical protein
MPINNFGRLIMFINVHPTYATVELAKMLDASEIVTYYRNAPHKVPAQPGDTFRALRMSWNGADRKDLIVSTDLVYTPPCTISDSDLPIMGD